MANNLSSTAGKKTAAKPRKGEAHKVRPPLMTISDRPSHPSGTPVQPVTNAGTSAAQSTPEASAAAALLSVATSPPTK